MLIPVGCFAAAVAPAHSIWNVICSLFWIWVHLLQFNISNQIVSLNEDRENKSYRPLPASLITIQHATALKYLLIPLCWALSAQYGATVLTASVFIGGLTILYNDLGAHAHWASRNLVNAAGFACYEIGSTLVASIHPQQPSDKMKAAVSLSALILATTIHAQDFRDQRGDVLIGRKTLPIVFGDNARSAMIILLALWSFSSSQLWELDIVSSMIICFLGLYVGFRFLFMTSTSDDKISYHWYNIWLALVHMMPVYSKLSNIVRA
ncbi:hypothetical protein VKT23_016115 [Stygiomarasmius scandens]|uniref:Uncharacterized protein n=1 Tax=Marasmiellus scandens TaxID=2682957 RepID=A0ABR1J087_9AGAR